jgi:ketosteroid isomerase-like protein
MSEENVELARRLLDRWNAGDHTFPDESVHPDIEVISHGLMAGRPLHGREGLRRFFRELDEEFAEFMVTAEEWREEGDRVGMLGRLHLRGRESGIPFDQPVVGVLGVVRDGQLIRIETFYDDPPGALEAAGLRE